MSEVWLPVVGMEGFYEVSNLGRVRTVGRIVSNGTGQRYVNPIIRSATRLRGGYVGLLLTKPGPVRKLRSVHRLVAQAFIPNPENLATVDHINFDKTDNRVENLRWLSKEDNTKAARGLSAVKRPKRAKKLTIDIVREIRARSGSCLQISKDFGLASTTVDRIRANKSWIEG